MKLTIESVQGGYIVEILDKEETKSAHDTLDGAFSAILELMEDRSINGAADTYGRVIVERNRPMDEQAYKVAKDLKHVEGEKVDKVSDIIDFDKKNPTSAVEKIKAAEKENE